MWSMRFLPFNPFVAPATVYSIISDERAPKRIKLLTTVLGEQTALGTIGSFVTVGQNNLARFSSKELMQYVRGWASTERQLCPVSLRASHSSTVTPCTYSIDSLEENPARFFCPTVTNVRLWLCNEHAFSSLQSICSPFNPFVCSPRTVVGSLMRLGAGSSEIIE